MGPLRAIVAALTGGFGAGNSPLPAGARVERDLAYGTDSAQCLDVYRPAGTPTGAILVVVHGGAWAIGDKANPAVVAAKVARWLPAGIIVASVNYRLLPLAGPLQQAGDVARAIAFVQKRAASWQADPARLVVVGHSTGAHLAALLAADPALREKEGAAPWLATILLDSAALDVVEIMHAPHRPFYDRAFGADEAGWQELSPLHRLRARPAPLLLVYSDARPDSAGASHRFAAAVAALGGRAEAYEVPLAHAEINAELGRVNAYTERVDAFLKSVGVP
jgi:arylformamidase